ncbi:hypothetical protein [Pseudobacteriovorax antillogorgiicola]|uniref:Uncharacterized protein n=1 Tax=Pseudobacteriovorax antillogorgiicola TaxID=1513793 RepID=A0A1Y6CF23_9BACT|nr:hypothetical protein [Pseudobacteriovorax antillogorgiicola]TCS47893.1 hypothetical protein EDD56_1194 [Pseudobacteriovorax antillogorgiicola]SMF57714.1 hypothetical protein SAMN06296036_1195 [Pseudobacteriovorax antillogorgiicola]
MKILLPFAESRGKALKSGLYYGAELGLLIGKEWGLNMAYGAYNGIPVLQLSLGLFFGAEG